MESITSLTNKRIKRLNKLLSNKERNKSHQFLVFDLKSVKKAYQLHRLIELYTLEKIDGINNVPAYLVNKEIMNKIKSNSTLIGVVEESASSFKTKDKIIYLDEIADPSNLGKIIYLMKQYQYQTLILSNKCVSPYNYKCLEIAKDNIFDIDISYGDIASLNKLKKDHQIISTGLSSSIYINEFKPKNKYVLIFGNEARGVSPNILKISDVVIKIPIKNIDSLNVAVAASIIMDNL